MDTKYSWVKYLVILSTLLTMAACSGGGGAPQAATATLETISVTPETTNINVGTIQAFTATGNYSDGSTQDITANAVWSSSDTGIAVINAAGEVSGVATGSVTISATLGGINGTAELTVDANPRTLDAITLTPATSTIQVNTRQSFIATGEYSDGSTLDISSFVTWSSSDTSIATVSATGEVFGVSEGSVMINATLGTVTGSAELLVSGVAPTLDSIRVLPDSAVISINATQSFTATGYYSDGSSQIITSGVSWTSSDSNIANVNATGEAIGVAAGKVTISAILGGVTGNASLTVSANAPTLDSIVVSPNTANINVGTIQAFTATGNYSDGSTQDITANAVWSSSDTGIAVINAAGEVSGVATGSVTISATLGGINGTAELTVDANPRTLDAITLTPATSTIQVNTRQSFIATGEYSDGSTLDISSFVTWSSSDTSIATVSATGEVFGVSEGSVMINATLGTVTGSAELLVSGVAPTLDSIRVLPDSAVISINATQSFTATGYYSDGSSQIITSGVSWTSSDSNIANVNATGEAIGVAAGKVTISAILGGVTGNASLTVSANAPTLDSIVVSPNTAAIDEGATQRFTATGIFSDGSSKDYSAIVVWNSNDATVASIDLNTGEATGLTSGTTTITARSGSIVGSATLTVRPALTSITIGPSAPVLAVSTNLQLNATGNYSDGSSANITSKVTWQSSNTSVATITKAGLAGGSGAGTASISATLLGVTTKVPIKVTLKPVTSIAVTPANAIIDIGETQAFTATGSLAGGGVVDLTDTVLWRSDDETVASIDAKGMATGVGIGSVSVTAEINDGALTDSSSLLVVGLTSIDIEQAGIPITNYSLHYGSAVPFTATGRYSSGISRDITDLVSWQSSDTGRVDAIYSSSFNSALVNAVDIGTASITATLNSITASVDINVIGVISLPKTGQTRCYYPSGALQDCNDISARGQDGAVQKGVSTPFRFGFGKYDNGNGCITDFQTGLTWTVDADHSAGSGLNWQPALDYIDTLNTNNFCGYSDWRLPNPRELLSLINFGEADPGQWLENIGFTHVYGYLHWTSTTYTANPDEAVIIETEFGALFPAGQPLSKPAPKNNRLYFVWPVRGGR